MNHTVFSFAAAGLLAGALSSPAQNLPPHMGPQQAGPFKKVILVSDEVVEGTLTDTLVDPMELSVAQDGRVFFAERAGKVKVWDPETKETTVVGEIEAFTGLEDGLLGITLDPNFTENGWVYLYYGQPETLVDSKGKYGFNVISRFDYRDGALVPASERVMLKVRSQREQCCHSGGSLAFGPDGNLFLSAGDNTNPFFDDTQPGGRSGFGPIDERPNRHPWDAQKSSANPNDLRGGVVRITPQNDGSYLIPEGNLFPEGEEGTRPEIYTMGCRNPFRISIDQKTGDLYWGDVGPDAGGFNPKFGPAGFDEVNQAREAGYFGWPYFVGANYAYWDYDYATGAQGERFDPKAPINDSPNNTGRKELPPAQPAFIFYPHAPSAQFPAVNGPGGRTAMAGPVYYYDENNPSPYKLPKSFDRTLFIYEWSRNWIVAVKLDEDRKIESMNRFLLGMTFKRPMDMELGPDGALYIIEFGTAWGNNTDTQIVRIEATQNDG